MTEARRERTNDQPDEHGPGFEFSFKLGDQQPVAGDPPQLTRLLEEAARKLGASSAGDAALSGGDASIEFKDGVLRIVSGEQEKFALDLTSGRSRGPVTDPFPLISKIRRWVNLAVTAVSLAIPIGLVAIGVATDQGFETTFYMGLFGLIIAAMLMSSLRLKRSPVEHLLPLLLQNGTRGPKSNVQPPAQDEPPSYFPKL